MIAAQENDYDISARRTRDEDQTPVFKGETHPQPDLTPKQYAVATSTCFIQFALYEAYGTRPYEWGDDPDRQKANTKEEEK
ncbi:MAG TPA: hypothetical protein VJ904_01945, partial [Tichowtungia sp.]|nr:hypothetical protein [Tichowtungia sp.]